MVPAFLKDTENLKWHPGGDKHFKTGENTQVVLALQKVDVCLHFDGNVRTQRNPQQRRALGYTAVINTMKDNFRVPPEMMPVYSVTNSRQHFVRLTCFINLRLHRSYQKPKMKKKKSVKNNKYSSAKGRYLGL